MAQPEFKELPDNAVFVFGSNEAGIHGAGAAHYAHVYKGAIMGLAFGLEDNSFAIPTKGRKRRGRTFTIGDTLSLSAIKRYVDSFLWHAKNNPNRIYQVTCIGCGLAGLKHEDIAPMFIGAPDNCWFDGKWHRFLGDRRTYWGQG